MKKKFQQATIIIACDDIFPLDILRNVVEDSTGESARAANLDLISITDIKDMQLVVEEEEA